MTLLSGKGNYTFNGKYPRSLKLKTVRRVKKAPRAKYRVFPRKINRDAPISSTKILSRLLFTQIKGENQPLLFSPLAPSLSTTTTVDNDGPGMGLLKREPVSGVRPTTETVQTPPSSLQTRRAATIEVSCEVSNFTTVQCPVRVTSKESQSFIVTQ